MEIIHATKLDGRNVRSTNKQGKTALKLAQARDMKPMGFVEAFQLMLDGIFAPKPGVPNDAAALATRVIWYSGSTVM